MSSLKVYCERDTYWLREFVCYIYTSYFQHYLQKYAIKVTTVYIAEVAVKPQIHATAATTAAHAGSPCRENDARQQKPEQCALLLTTTERSWSVSEASQ